MSRSRAAFRHRFPPGGEHEDGVHLVGRHHTGGRAQRSLGRAGEHAWAHHVGDPVAGERGRDNGCRSRIHDRILDGRRRGDIGGTPIGLRGATYPCPQADDAVGGQRRRSRPRSSRPRAAPRPCARRGPAAARRTRAARRRPRTPAPTSCGRRAAGGSRSPRAAGAATSPTSCTGAPGTPCELLEPGRRLLGEPLAQQRQQRVAVRDPVGVRREAGVVGELRPADRLEKRGEEPVVRGGDHQLRRRPRRTPGTARSRGTPSPAASAPRPSRGRPGELVGDERERGLPERDVDVASARPAALCSAARIENAAHIPVPWSISETPTRTPGRSGSPVTLMIPPPPGAAGRSRGAPRRAPRGRRRRSCSRRARVARAQRVGAEAELVGDARAQALDEDVGAVDQPLEHLAPALAGRAPTDRFPELAATKIALPPAKNCGPQARASSPARGLDLDHVRAERARGAGCSSGRRTRW